MRRKQGSRRAPSTTLAALLVLAECAGRSSAESSCAEVSTLAGSGSYAFADGTGAAASFKYPSGVAYSPSGGQSATMGEARISLGGKPFISFNEQRIKNCGY